MHAYLIEGACGKIVCNLFVEGKKMKKMHLIHYDDFISLAIETYRCFGENPLRCTTQDEKGLVLIAIPFCLIF
jgi:hypothetical protein